MRFLAGFGLGWLLTVLVGVAVEIVTGEPDMRMGLIAVGVGVVFGVVNVQRTEPVRVIAQRWWDAIVRKVPD